MPSHPRESQTPYLFVPPRARSPWRPYRGLWPGVLLAGAAAGLLVLSLLALAGLAGLLAGLRGAPEEPVSSPASAPTALVLVLPGVAAVEEPVVMPGPAELASLAAAPLPASTPQPQQPAAPASGVQAAEPQPQLGRQEKKATTYGDLFRRVGDQTGIDWRLLAALSYRESRMNPLALGRDGDMGLMQILPATWDEFAPEVPASDPFDPRENVQVAAAYLLYLQDFLLGLGTNDLRWVLAAYNWGPERVRRLLANGGRWEDLPALQQRYVADILYTAYGRE